MLCTNTKTIGQLPNKSCINETRWDFNRLRPRRNWYHFADDIFKRIFFSENVWISITISLKFVPTGRINNIPAVVQIMAWRRPGDMPLSEPMVVSLLTHICVTRPQWGISDGFIILYRALVSDVLWMVPPRYSLPFAIQRHHTRFKGRNIVVFCIQWPNHECITILTLRYYHKLVSLPLHHMVSYLCFSLQTSN